MTTGNDLRKLALAMAVGLCDAIGEGAISVDEASHYLFSPRTMRLFSSDQEVAGIIHLATEFEDLVQLAPDALPDAVADVKRRAIVALKATPPMRLPAGLLVGRAGPNPGLIRV